MSMINRNEHAQYSVLGNNREISSVISWAVMLRILNSEDI